MGRLLQKFQPCYVRLAQLMAVVRRAKSHAILYLVWDMPSVLLNVRCLDTE
jgi:hypothetical protein